MKNVFYMHDSAPSPKDKYGSILNAIQHSGHSTKCGGSVLDAW